MEDAGIGGCTSGNLRGNPDCDCGNNRKTMRHITDECPRRNFVLGINRINKVTTEAIE